MRAVDVYLMYCALKAHFKGDYDYHKFSGQTKIKRDSFFKRKDRILFVKVGQKYEDGEMSYILAPNKIKVGDTVTSGRKKEIKNGNCMPLSDIPDGTSIHNIELNPNGGGKLARSAGASAITSGMDNNYCVLFS